MAKTARLAWLQICSVPSRLAISFQEHGLLITFRRCRRRLREWILERRLGIRTAGSIDATVLQTGAESFGYQPIPYAAFEAALKSIQVDSNDVFVDLGCGLGRAVVLAGLGPFRRVVGVEISAELCAEARRNIANARRHLQGEATIIQADARDYVLPDDATVLMLFNPFDEPVLRRVLENTRQSLERAPRVLTIIYAIPNSRYDLLAEVPWLQLQETRQVTDEAWLRLGIYRSSRDLS